MPYVIEWKVPFAYYVMDQTDFITKFAYQWNFALVFHDGNHEPEKVRFDLQELSWYITTNGMVAIDDARFDTALLKSSGLEQRDRAGGVLEVLQKV